MTTQLALANSYGIALASDRHIFRDGPARSTGQEIKLRRLRGPVPGAMMAAGPLAILDVPVSRLALLLERAVAAVAEDGPDALAQAVLSALSAPLCRGPGPEPGADDDAELLAETVERVVESALGGGGEPRSGLQALIATLDRAAPCRDEAAIRAAGAAAWEARAADVRTLLREKAAAALRDSPELLGRAVVAALSRDWRENSDLFLLVGLCCPATGVPVLLALRLWRGLGGRLLAVSRLSGEYETVWRASRTVAIAQGSGRAIVEAMVDGIAEDHFVKLAAGQRAKIGPAMTARWDCAHERIAVSSVSELGALATGLVRGAETIGYLTRESEGTIAGVDCALVTPGGVTEYVLPAQSAGRLELA